MPRKKIIIISSVLVLFIAIVLIALTLVDSYLERLVEKNLESYIDTSPERLYDYAYESIDIDVYSGSVYLKGVSMEPRQFAMDSIAQDKIKVLMSVEVEELALEDLELYNLLMEDIIEVGELKIINPRFRYIFNNLVESKPSTFVMSNIFSEQLDYALIHDFSIENASISMEEIHSKDSSYVSLDSTFLNVTEVFIDENTADHIQPFNYNSLMVSAVNLTGTFVENYNIGAKSLSINSSESSIKVNSFHFLPKAFNLLDTSKQFDRSVFIINAHEITISSLNFFTWDSLGRMEIDKIAILEPSIKVSMDRRWLKPMHERLLPAANIRGIPVPLKLDSVEVKDGDVYYKEIFTDGKPPLELNFGQVYASLQNISNDTSILESNPNLLFFANTLFLDSGKLDIKAAFPILSPVDSFNMRVKMDTMPLTVLNPILEGQMKVNVEGDINALEMNFGATRHRSIGTLAFDYSGLKLELLKIKETKTGEKVKKEWLLNALVNPILRSNNNRDKDNFKEGIVDYERPLDISFFGLIWQSLKAGLMTTVVPEKKHAVEKKEKKELKKEEKAAKKKNK